MNQSVVLDACALIALLKNENGAEKVAEIIENAENGDTNVIINRVNLLEVYYGFYHNDGKEYAERIINNITQSPIVVTEFDETLFYQAGRLKATYKISLADSIVLAQALVTGGELLTADHHEFNVIEKQEDIRFLWIR
jgi:predicted nucleic acid-binding protein